MSKIMTHVVAGYPGEEECIQLLLGMEKAGINMIEVQIPFSDPIADGETIMAANDRAIERGMTTEKSFDLIKAARKAGLEADIYIMSYIQKVLSYGFENFCTKAESVGAKGLIIPDLPIDSEEFEILNKSAGRRNLQIVPVVSPGMDNERLEKCIANAGSLIYLTSIKGITGSKLALSRQLKQAAVDVKRQNPDCVLAVGFGIGDKKDINEVMEIADVAVIGSAAIRRITEGGLASVLKFLEALV